MKPLWRMFDVFVSLLSQYKKNHLKFVAPMALGSLNFTQNSKLHSDLISRLRSQNVIKSLSVAETMLAVDRFYYSKYYPYADSPQSIGFGATISAPHMHAYALELLKDKLVPGEKALDVGCGSGYLTACMAIMMGESGKVIGIEHVPELAELCKENISQGNPDLLDAERIIIVTGDGRLGHPEHAPYNAIHVGAAANDVPSTLVNQLKVGGRLIMPVGNNFGEQELIQLDKQEDGVTTRRNVVQVRFVPLTNRAKQWPWGSSSKR